MDFSFLKRTSCSWLLSERECEECYKTWYKTLSDEEKKRLKPTSLPPSDLQQRKELFEIARYKSEKKKQALITASIKICQIILIVIIGMSSLIILRDAHMMEKYIGETEEIVFALEAENKAGKLDPVKHRKTIQRLNDLVLKHGDIEAYHSIQIGGTIILSLILLLWYFLLLFNKQRNITKNFQSIYSSAQSFILLINPVTRQIIDANPAFLKTLGIPLQKLKELTLDEIEVEKDDEGTDFLQMKWFPKKDGSLVNVEVDRSNVKYNDEEATLFVMKDVTERNRMEKQIHEKMLELESTMFNLIQTKEALNSTNVALSNALQKAVDISTYLLHKSPLVPSFLFSPIFHLSHDREGGDSLIFTSFRERYIGLFLQDVCGHDINAILDSIYANLLVESYKVDQAKKSVRIPEMVLYYLNKDLNEYYQNLGNASEENAGKFTTAVYSLLDYERGEVCISLAGHEPVIALSENGSYHFIEAGGLPLGLYPPEDDEDYQSETYKLASGEKLFFFTDGVMEQTNPQGETFKHYFLENFLPQMACLNATECYKLFQNSFLAFVGDENLPDDDITFFVVERKPEYAYHHIQFIPSDSLVEEAITKLVEVNQVISLSDLKKIHNERVKKESETDTSMRRINSFEEGYAPLIEFLRKEIDLSEDLLFRIRYCLEEAIANAIEHGNLASPHYSVHLSWTLYGNILECCIEDEGEGVQEGDIPQRSSSDEALWTPYGRGRRIIEQYSDYVYNNSKGNALYILFKLPKNENANDRSKERKLQLGATEESNLVK